MIGQELCSYFNGRKVNQYTFLRKIGEGGFSTVWLAHSEIPNIDVAIKVVPKEFLEAQNCSTILQREVNLLKSLDHPFIAKYYEYLEDSLNHYIVMENVSNGNLLDYVNARGRLDENTARKYFIQLISVIDYLHSVKRIVHRDLKAENVLLDRNFNIKIIDFGLSNSFTEANEKLSTTCGSPAYAAPEMIQGEAYTKAVDIWSAGIILFSICACELPFFDADPHKLLQIVVYRDPIYPEYMSPALIDLLKKMLTKNPEKRITIEGIKNHHWYSEVDYSPVVPNTKAHESISIDKVIIDLMIGKGVNTEGLNESLLSNTQNALTSIYQQFRREYNEGQSNRFTNNMKKPAFPSRSDAPRQHALQLPSSFAPAARRMTRPAVLKKPIVQRLSKGKIKMI